MIDINSQNTNKLSKSFRKVLICLIILFASLIYTDISNKNLEKYKNIVFNNTFDFMSFNKLYTKYFGNIKKNKNASEVFSTSSFDYNSKNSYLNGEEYLVNKDTIINTITGGIVVFIGEKDNFGNTVIIQGSDGYDIWYGNLENISVNMYDYIDKNTILGNSSDKLYLLITKDNNYYTYEDYQNK